VPSLNPCPHVAALHHSQTSGGLMGCASVIERITEVNQSAF